MNVRRRLLDCLAAVAIVAAAASATGFKLRDPITPANDKRPDEFGPYRHWDLREFQFCRVPYAVANNCRDLANVVPACDAAAATWTSVLPSRLFLNNVGAADSVLGGDNKNSLFWDDSNLTGLFTVGDGTLAITIPTYLGGGTGALRECDIVFNDMEFLWTTTLGDSSASSRIFTGTTSTWDFDQDNNGAIDNNVLNVRIHGTDNRTVTFTAADFNDIDAATVDEVRDAINAAMGAFAGRHRVLALSYNDSTVSIEDDPQLPINPTTGEISIQVTGGSANTILAFPVAKKVGNLRFDVETVCLHEMGHFIGLAHTGPEAVVMFPAAPNTGTKRVLTEDDRNGCSYLNSPDLGDAEDPTYPSFVHGTANSRVLNGVQLKAPALGAMHINGLEPKFQYVKLGATINPNNAECESNQVDQDQGDDGVNVIPPPSLPDNYIVQVNMTVAADDSGRSLSGAGDLYYLNGWFDWNNNGVWDEPDEHEIQFAAAGSANNQYIMTPAEHGNATSFWCRFRVDYGEDCGNVRNVSGDLDNVRGAAQYGEVEDYYFNFNIVPVELEFLNAIDEGAGARVAWRPSEERNAAGYHVWRSMEGAERERMTEALVTAVGAGRTYEWVDVTAPPEGRVEYFIEEVTRTGLAGKVFGPILLSRRPLTAALGVPYPNPARGPVTIEFTIDRQREARLDVFDLSGRLVKTLASGPLPRGNQTATWDGRDQAGSPVAAGIYMVRLTLDDGWKTTRKVTIAR